MPLPASIRPFLGYLKRAFDFRSFRVAGLIQRNLPNIAWPLTRASGGQITAEAIGLTFDPLKFEPLVEQMRPLATIVSSGLGTLEMQNGVPTLLAGPVRVALDNSETVNIVAEVFGEGAYDFSPLKEALVVDIGMNVGIAALYFAGIKGWEVVGYEPFPATFATAQRHIEASGLTGKIEARNLGLSDRDGTETLPFDPFRTGRNGLFYREVYNESHATQEIRLSDAATAFRELRERAGDRALVVKMDCEGAEYAIFRRLVEEDLLSTIDAIVLEFHPFVPGQSALDLERMLLDAGFFVHLPRARAKSVDLMWGVRLANRTPPTAN